MFRNQILRIFLLVGCGVAALICVSADTRQETLRSFYIARFFFSDYLPAWSDSILDVSPEADGVHVRLIRMSQANDYCPGLVVRALEKTLPRTSVREVAGIDMCAFTSRQVAAALKKAAAGGDPSDSATETIVAACAARQREFDFPYPVDVDQKVLSRSNLSVFNLWDTYSRIYRQAFGSDFSFDKLTPDEARQAEDRGTKLLPDLKSGKYQLAYAGMKCGDRDCDNYLAWRLDRYNGAPQAYDPGAATLLDAATLPLTKYVAPTMPPLAKLARISGDVRLRILVDRQTGLVRNVEALSGHQLLLEPSITTAQSWQFDPQALSEPSVEVTLRFQLHCQ
jgi:hypothetical protein